MDADHLLLGLFEPADSMAARVLPDCGATAATIRAEVARRPSRDEPDEADGSFTESALGVLREAETQAKRLGHNYIGTEHILLALVCKPADTVVLALPAALHRHGDVKKRVVGYL